MISREALEWVWKALDEHARNGKPVVLAGSPPGAAVLYRWAQRDHDKFVNFYLKMAERDLVAAEKMQEDVGTKLSIKEIESLLEEYGSGTVDETSREHAGKPAVP